MAELRREIHEGDNLEVLRDLGEQVRAVLATTEGVTFSTAKLAGGEPKLLIQADEDQAGLVGIQLADIADQLNSGLEGALGGSLLEANQELPVRVRVEGAERESVSRIVAGRVLPPVRPSDTARADVPGVPLTALADVELVPELAAAHTGQVIVFFVLAVAAAEAAVGLALFIAVYRNRRTIDVNRQDLMRW